MNLRNRIILFALFSCVLASASPGTVFAQENESAMDWQFFTEVYMWGASVGGETTTGSDIDVDFGDILDNLEMGFMGFVGAQKGKWSILADFIYLDVGKDTTLQPGVKASADLKAWIITPAVGYNLVDSNLARLDVIAGARYLDLDAELGVGPINVEDSVSYWDGIIGIRGDIKLTDTWHLPCHLDVGTGESKYSWQALAGIGYKFSMVDVIVAYRYLSYEFDDPKLVDNLNIHGPFAGFKFTF